MTIVDTMVDVINSATQKSAPRYWLPVMACEEFSPIISTDSRIGFSLSNQEVNRWLSRIREELYAITSVEDVFFSIEDSNVDIWVVIPERDIAVLDQLADIEWKLLEMFVSGEHPTFLIDFHVIYRCGRNIGDLVPTKAIRLPRQVE